MLFSKSALTKIRGVIIALIIIVIAVAGVYTLSLPYFNPSKLETAPTPTPTISPRPSPTVIPTPTPSPTASPTPSPSPNPTATPTPSPSPTPTPEPIAKYSLSEAMTAGYVEANITGSSALPFGVSSGDSILLNAKRLVNFTIEIEPIPTGSLLVTSGDTQNMSVLKLKGLKSGLGYCPRDKIILDTQDDVQYLFSGYCVSFNGKNPSSSTLFTLTGMADEDVLKIYSVLDQLPENVTSIAAIQTAIFVVTDDISYTELESRYSTGIAEIPNARTILETAEINTSSKKLFL